MKLINTNKIIMNFLIAFSLLFLMAGNVAAADNTDRESFLQSQVDDMDPIIQPYAQFVADNLVAVFLFMGGCYLLYDGIMERRYRKKGKTNEAAEHKNNLIEDAGQLGLALVLFAIFVAAVKSDLVGLV